MKTAGDPPRTLMEQLTHDLEQTAAGVNIQFGKTYSDRMRMSYKMKSAEMQALSYSPPRPDGEVAVYGFTVLALMTQ